MVSDPQRPHGLQPTRLLRPRNFPGRSTGIETTAIQKGANRNTLIIDFNVLYLAQHRLSREICMLSHFSCSHVQLFATPWTIACQGPLQARILEWVAMPSPGHLPHPGINPVCHVSCTGNLPLAPPGKPQRKYKRLK